MKKELQGRAKLLTIAEASKLVEGLSVHELRKLCRSGELPNIKTSRKYLIPESVLLEFLHIPYCPHIIAIEESEPIRVDDFVGYSGLESLNCPYCGYSHGELEYDLWELEDEGKFVCDDCGRTMKYSRNYVTCFRSEPVKRKDKTKYL